MELARRARAGLGSVVLVALPLFALSNVWYPLIPMQERALLAIFALVAFYSLTKPKTPRLLAVDILNIALSVLSFGYVVIEWQDLLLRQGIPTTTDLVFGCVGMYLILFATIRGLGLGLAFVVVGFLAYTFLGQFLPIWLGGHRGYSLQRIFTFLFVNENGVLGFAIDASLKYMALFLLLGKVLQFSGALAFIMNLARALFGSGTTGPPMVAVFSSALLGTVTGSSMGNVYISGNVTIPMMKRVGIKPELAAAIEAAASNGAQILPPVMGFAVFFMVVMLDTSYISIITAALIPGILYFVTLGAAVWARTRGIARADGGDDAFDQERMSVGQALKSVGALSFVVTLGSLIYFLIQRDSLQMAAINSMAICIVVSMIGKDRYTPKKVYETLRESGRELTEVTVVCLALGLITGPILLTGLGTKLPALMLDWASGDLALLLIAAFAACVVLGLGVPTSMAYVIVALLVTSAITQLGVPKLSAHMFVFYAALAAMITPPVALTAYAAATIAGSDYWKTGWLAATLGMTKYLVPFAFVFRPELLMQGTVLGVIGVTLLTTAGLLAICYGLSVLDKHGPVGIVRIATLVVGGFLVAVPPIGIVYITIGIALCAVGAALSLYLRPSLSSSPVR